MGGKKIIGGGGLGLEESSNKIYKGKRDCDSPKGQPVFSRGLHRGEDPGGKKKRGPPSHKGKKKSLSKEERKEKRVPFGWGKQRSSSTWGKEGDFITILKGKKRKGEHPLNSGSTLSKPVQQ